MTGILIGLFLAVLVSLAAWRARALTAPGAAAAALLGALVFGLGGLGWAALLLGFFLSSSALSRLFRSRKTVFQATFSKGSQRDAGQVLANGAAAGLFVLLHSAFPAESWPWFGFAGALAAANADTWATELGVLSRSEPRLITTGRKVAPGTSGGITWAGSLAALGGALLVAFLAVLFWKGAAAQPVANAPAWWTALLGSPEPVSFPERLTWLAWLALCGLAGSLLDSWLGATVQAIYTCPNCARETEQHPLHGCGTPTRLVRGWPWINNDLVNVCCTLAGGLIALIPFLL